MRLQTKNEKIPCFDTERSPEYSYVRESQVGIEHIQHATFKIRNKRQIRIFIHMCAYI